MFWLYLAKVLFYGGHTEQEYCSGISDGQLRHSARYGVSASRIQVIIWFGELVLLEFLLFVRIM